MKLFRDIGVMQQVERMVSEGLLGREVDLYAFYAESDKSDKRGVHVFMDALECYEAMFELSLEGNLVSDAVCLMNVVKGEADVEKLERNLLDLLEKEKMAYVLGDEGASEFRVAVIESGSDCKEALSKENATLCKMSGFIWDENGSVCVYSNPFLPQAWRTWRDKQKRGMATSPLFRKEVAVKHRQLSDCRADFESELLKRYSARVS